MHPKSDPRALHLHAHPTRSSPSNTPRLPLPHPHAPPIHTFTPTSARSLTHPHPLPTPTPRRRQKENQEDLLNRVNQATLNMLNKGAGDGRGGTGAAGRRVSEITAYRGVGEMQQYQSLTVQVCRGGGEERGGIAVGWVCWG